jgi:hypothetical protein
MAFTWNEDGHHVEDGRVLIGDDAMRKQRTSSSFVDPPSEYVVTMLPSAAEAATLSEKFTNADRKRIARQFGTNEKYLANAPLDEEVPEGWHYVTETEISHLVDALAKAAIEGLLEERAADWALRN